MHVVVDYEACESNALCMQKAPTVFEVRDDDNLYVLDEDPGPELADAVRAAARICPRQAITLVE